MAHGDRSVDVFVGKLRQKLRAASPEWTYIHTHFGVGYRFAAEHDGPAHLAHENRNLSEHTQPAGEPSPTAVDARPAESVLV
jgi:DNA-binding winged helix-turn-helix (wHTH) protein